MTGLTTSVKQQHRWVRRVTDDVSGEFDPVGRSQTNRCGHASTSLEMIVFMISLVPP